MGQFLNSVNEVRKNYKNYDDWEQRQADERARKEYLVQHLNIPKDKLELTQKRAQTVIRAAEILDKRSEDNCENMEQLTGIISSIPILGIGFAQPPLSKFLNKKIDKEYKKRLETLKLSLTPEYNTKIKELNKWHSKTSTKVGMMLSAGSIIAMFFTGILTILWGNSKQKNASRIGRYQAKQNELQDLKNFVVYTPEQLEKAEEIARKIPDEKERNSISKIIKELKDVSKDKKAYKKWLANKDPKEIEKLKSVNLTPEELQRANEDRELIVDAVKEINIKAEEYSENIENAFDTFSTLSWLAAAPLGFGLNKLLKLFNVSRKMRRPISWLVPVITSLTIQLSGTIQQKKGSRVGRYKARQDLLKNPARLMAYTDEDMEKAKDVKAPKQKISLLKKIGNSFIFIKQYIKDSKEYKKYKRTTEKENEKIYKAFKEIKISEAQKEEAKALQKNIFRAFDEIDEFSQRYSEDTEAACDIAKQTGSTLWSIGSLVGMTLLGLSVAKGKFPITKLVNKLTNLTFDKNSSIRVSVNNLHNILKAQGKANTKEFQKSLVTGKMGNYLSKPENKAVKDAISSLKEEFAKISTGSISQIKKGDKKNLSSILSVMFKEHFKKSILAKWGKNLVTQGTKLWIKSKAERLETIIPKELEKEIGLNFNYKNYRTLINTGIAAGVPLLGTIFAVPYAFNAWLTNIQKKAGKIGIMKAMDTIDDPRIFANKDNTQSQNNNEIKDTTLLNKFKK